MQPNTYIKKLHLDLTTTNVAHKKKSRIVQSLKFSVQKSVCKICHKDLSVSEILVGEEYCSNCSKRQSLTRHRHAEPRRDRGPGKQSHTTMPSRPRAMSASSTRILKNDSLVTPKSKPKPNLSSQISSQIKSVGEPDIPIKASSILPRKFSVALSRKTSKFPLQTLQPGLADSSSLDIDSVSSSTSSDSSTTSSSFASASTSLCSSSASTSQLPSMSSNGDREIFKTGKTEVSQPGIKITIPPVRPINGENHSKIDHENDIDNTQGFSNIIKSEGKRHIFRQARVGGISSKDLLHYAKLKRIQSQVVNCWNIKYSSPLLIFRRGETGQLTDVFCNLRNDRQQGQRNFSMYAIADIVEPISVMSVELREVAYYGGILSIGIAKKACIGPQFTAFGASPSSWGLHEVRSKGGIHASQLSNSGIFSMKFRSFRVKDVITLCYFYQSRSVHIFVNDNEFMSEIQLPSDFPVAFVFGVTVAFDHSIRIIPKEFSIPSTEKLLLAMSSSWVRNGIWNGQKLQSGRDEIAVAKGKDDDENSVAKDLDLSNSGRLIRAQQTCTYPNSDKYNSDCLPFYKSHDVTELVSKYEDEEVLPWLLVEKRLKLDIFNPSVLSCMDDSQLPNRGIPFRIASALSMPHSFSITQTATLTATNIRGNITGYPKFGVHCSVLQEESSAVHCDRATNGVNRTVTESNRIDLSSRLVWTEAGAGAIPPGAVHVCPIWSALQHGCVKAYCVRIVLDDCYCYGVCGVGVGELWQVIWQGDLIRGDDDCQYLVLQTPNSLCHDGRKDGEGEGEGECDRERGEQCDTGVAWVSWDVSREHQKSGFYRHLRSRIDTSGPAGSTAAAVGFGGGAGGGSGSSSSSGGGGGSEGVRQGSVEGDESVGRCRLTSSSREVVEYLKHTNIAADALVFASLAVPAASVALRRDFLAETHDNNDIRNRNGNRNGNNTINTVPIGKFVNNNDSSNLTSSEKDESGDVVSEIYLARVLLDGDICFALYSPTPYYPCSADIPGAGFGICITENKLKMFHLYSDKVLPIELLSLY